MPKSLSFWIPVSACLLLLAGILSFPGTFGLTRGAEVTGVETTDSFALTAQMPPHLKKERGRDILFRDTPVLCEDGVPLSRPDSSEKEITNAGRGRYKITGGKILFSTSDGAPMAGRKYAVRVPMWSIREPLLLAVWFLALVSSSIALRMALPDGGNSMIEKPVFLAVPLVLSLLLVAIFIIFRPQLSDLFFLGLLVPAIWAALMASLAMQRHIICRAALPVLALLPALAGYFYYGVNGASHGSFLVAGVIPYSDARILFLQAAEIAIQGTTGYMFNGRFLYPGFYAALLNLTGLNILIANLLVSSIVMVGLALTCSLVSRRAGFAGTAIYCLLFWLYFRAHGCGLLMTENLGLLLGVIGFGFLLLSVDKKTLWPVFVSIAFIGLGSAARPGAMFVLPSLVLYAGIRAWMSQSGRLRTAAAAGAIFLGLVTVAGCFGANHFIVKTLSRGESKNFGNFAFTLHGLLNNTKWSTSAEQFNWDTSLIMERNIRQIKESPMSLVSGIGRAYGEAFHKRFLFRFGEEKRLASPGMILFALAFFGCWFWKPLHGDSWWILLAVAGILASIPFAPPWDAGERPYAVTEPIQIFLVAAGAAMLLDLLAKLAAIVLPLPTDDRCGPLEPVRASGLIVFAALCFILVLPVPLALKMAGVRSPVLTESPALIPGSRLLISREAHLHEDAIDRSQYLDRLSDFQAAYPKESLPFLSETEDFLLAINWKDLGTVVLKSPNIPSFSK